MVELRGAGPDDVDAVLTFWREHAEGTDRDDDRPAVERLLDRDASALLLAERDGQLVGTLIAGWDGWRCHLYRLAVHADARRAGVARLLVGEAERRFSEAGGRRADAMVLAGNELGEHAWRALGYAPQPAWRRWVRALV